MMMMIVIGQNEVNVKHGLIQIVLRTILKIIQERENGEVKLLAPIDLTADDNVAKIVCKSCIFIDEFPSKSYT